VIALLDVNVLVALAWPSHLHHEAAHRWFARQKALGWATCPVTESGFVRISSNPSVFADARSPAEALALLGRIVQVAGHQFWADDVSLVSAEGFLGLALTGHRQVTDAHLLCLARRRGGRLATFDRSVGRLLPAGAPAEQAIVFIPVDRR
jgi:uncharacterized protein